MVEGWKYYNHAMISLAEPHKNCTPPENKRELWKNGEGTALFARWTTEFDCGYETEWWYVIKDSPFRIDELKAKRRYEINKGRKNFSVREIDPSEYGEEIFNITIKAYSQWPEKYRPVVEKESFMRDMSDWNRYTVLGGFDNESGGLSAYALIQSVGKCINFNVLRVDPEAEKKAVNAAMVDGLIQKYKECLENGGYICDGSRSVRHETAFQDYLEKYFGFRKAYCRLNICYRFPMNLAVGFLYPFRNKVNKESRVGSLIYSVLQMEEICRSFK